MKTVAEESEPLSPRFIFNWKSIFKICKSEALSFKTRAIVSQYTTILFEISLVVFSFLLFASYSLVLSAHSASTVNAVIIRIQLLGPLGMMCGLLIPSAFLALGPSIFQYPKNCYPSTLIFSRTSAMYLFFWAYIGLNAVLRNHSMGREGSWGTNPICILLNLWREVVNELFSKTASNSQRLMPFSKISTLFNFYGVHGQFHKKTIL